MSSMNGHPRPPARQWAAQESGGDVVITLPTGETLMAIDGDTARHLTKEEAGHLLSDQSFRDALRRACVGVRARAGRGEEP